MKKKLAIDLCGGTVQLAAEKVGVTYQAVNKWPDELPPRIADRVIAALVREGKDVPVELLTARVPETAKEAA